MKKLFLLSIASMLLLSYSVRITTDSFPILRNGNFAALWFGGVTVGSGNIGMDIGFSSPQNPTIYSPCAVHSDENGTYNDPFFGACLMPQSQNSYYQYHSWGSGWNSFPYGMFINQSDNGIVHSWGNRATFAGLEFYPTTNKTGDDNDGYNTLTNKYGGVRLSLSNQSLFPISANGGYYTNYLGTINSLPTAPSNAILNGYVQNTRGGSSPVNGSVVVAFFQQYGTIGYTTTGYPYYSFAAPTNGDYGYYYSGPLYSGCYVVIVQQYDAPVNSGPVNLIREVSVSADINQPNLRVDFILDEPYFGYQNMSACHQRIYDNLY